MIVKKEILFLAILVAFGLLAGCKGGTPYEKPPLPVKTQLVQASSGEDDRHYSATIKPGLQMELAFRQGGYVQELSIITPAKGTGRPVQEGDWVAKGTVLARIGQNDYLAKVQQIKAQLGEAEALREQAQAQLKEAQASLDQAQLDFERASALFIQKSLIKPEYDAAKARLEAGQARVQAATAQVATARAKVKGAQAALEEGEIVLKDTALRAPMDGVVLKKMIEKGALVSPGALAFVLADTSSMKIVFGAPDLALSKIRRQTPVAVTVEAVSGLVLKGRIERISPAADPTSRLFEVEIILSNPQNRLKAGMIASVRLPGGKPAKALPVLPLSAVIRSQTTPSGYAVFVVEEQGGRQKARLRPVQLGETLGNTISLIEGLTIGERVVATGAEFLTDGQPVKIIP